MTRVIESEEGNSEYIGEPMLIEEKDTLGEYWPNLIEKWKILSKYKKYHDAVVDHAALNIQVYTMLFN